MKKNILFITMGLSLVGGSVFAQVARDWHEFHKFHEHVQEAIQEVEIARSTTNTVPGQGGKAEGFLRQAEEELRMADNSTNSD